MFRLVTGLVLAAALWLQGTSCPMVRRLDSLRDLARWLPSLIGAAVYGGTLLILLGSKWRDFRVSRATISAFMHYCRAGEVDIADCRRVWGQACCCPLLQNS
jgi:hypothetical protein